jgi:hypothetical protein
LLLVVAWALLNVKLWWASDSARILLGEAAVLHFVSFTAFYVDPGSGSMILQLLLGGVSGVYVIFRLFKQKILSMFGIATHDTSVVKPLTGPVPPESEDPHRRSA